MRKSRASDQDCIHPAQAQLNGAFDVVFHYPSNSLFFFDGANSVVRRIQ